MSRLKHGGTADPACFAAGTESGLWIYWMLTPSLVEMTWWQCQKWQLIRPTAFSSTMRCLAAPMSANEWIEENVREVRLHYWKPSSAAQKPRHQPRRPLPCCTHTWYTHDGCASSLQQDNIQSQILYLYCVQLFSKKLTISNSLEGLGAC